MEGPGDTDDLLDPDFWSPKGTMEGPGETDDWLDQDLWSGKGKMEGPGETDDFMNLLDLLAQNDSGKGKMEGPGETDDLMNLLDLLAQNDERHFEEMAKVRDIRKRRAEQSKKIDAEAQKIKSEGEKLAEKPDSDPKVVEAVRFVENMTAELMEQKERLTKCSVKVTGTKSSTHTRKAQKPRPNCSSDLSAHISTPVSHVLQGGRVEDEDMETYEQPRMQRGDVLERAHLKILSPSDEKLKDVDQSPKTTTMLPEPTNNVASLRRVYHDVKKYIQQINELVQEKIRNLPEEVQEKINSVMMSFKILIAGMWKLLLFDVLLYELTSLISSSQSENATISSKKRRSKYGFQMASMMVLWLAHDVESNPGPPFHIRVSIEKLTRSLSQVLRYHLPVEGSLWSESVAEAAYAAGYSSECKWSNPSGNSKDKLMTLIERATELGRLLNSMDCLPAEFSPFVNDLEHNAIQEQLVIHYKVKNLRSAVDIILGISSLGDEHKQTIMQEMLRLKQISEVPRSSKSPTCTTTDFEQLADSTISHPNISYQKKTIRRKPKQDRHRNEQGNQFDNLDMSQNFAVPEQEAAVTLGQQMDPGSDGENETSIALNLDETLSTVSKVREVTVQEDMATKSLSARKTDRTSTSDETFGVGTKESEPVGSTGEAISILNEILDSNMTFSQSHDIEILDDILVCLDGTETQVQNAMGADARNNDMPRTATNFTGMTQLQKADGNLNDQLAYPPTQSPVDSLSHESNQICQTHDAHTNKHIETENLNPLKYDSQIQELQNLIPGQNASCKENNYWSAEGNANDSGVEESSMNINPDITESHKGSDSTLQENTGEGSSTNYLERDRDNVTQDREDAEEHRTEDDDSIEHFVQREQISKTESETDFIQQTTSPQATGPNICHEAVRDEVTSVGGGRRKGAEGDACENEAQTLSSGDEQFAAAETESIQQTVSPLAAVTQRYPDTDRHEMCREEKVDDNISETRENEAEDLTLGTEQFARIEPADTGKQRMERTADEHFAKFKAALLEEVDARLEAFKASLANNTPNEQFVQNENGDPLDCASSDEEHTEPRVRSSDTSRKRNLTDPENGPTSKKWRQ